MLVQLRRACESRDIDTMMSFYPTLVQVRALDHRDMRLIAQALHNRARTRKLHVAQSLAPFIEQFVADIRSGALPPQPFAFVHLFGIYKEFRNYPAGRELWQWLVQQDDTYVSQAVYGAAIELLAYERKSSLQDLENLYKQGLKRFPGVFAEYHLSPDAIVPDRAQPIAVSGIPTVLLQGILTARLLARDWQRAYLALDTILRLYPTQTPRRFFGLFMLERPIAEVYAAFIVACRAGTDLNSHSVSTLLTKLKQAMSNSKSMADRMMVLRAVANALYAYQSAGGQLDSMHVALFLQCFQHILPEKTPSEDYLGEPATLRNIIALSAHENLGGLMQAGFPASVEPLNALVSLAGTLHVPRLLTTVLEDIQAAQIPLDPVGIRNALTSAGMVKSPEVIQELWSSIVSTADAEGSQIASKDWQTFTKACRRAGLREYFHEQLSKLAHTTTADLCAQLTLLIDATDREVVVPDFEYISADELTAEFETLQQQMKNVQAILMSGQPLDLRTSPFYMHIDPATSAPGTLDDLRAVYDSLTTDPHQPPPAPDVDGSPLQPALSPTKIPLDELRFMNWLSVLEMMLQAESYDAAQAAEAERAMAAGEPFNSKIFDTFKRHEKAEPLNIEQLRQKIVTLRHGRDVVDWPTIRKFTRRETGRDSERDWGALTQKIRNFRIRNVIVDSNNASKS